MCKCWVQAAPAISKLQFYPQRIHPVLNSRIIKPCLCISIKRVENRGHSMVLITLLGVLTAVTFQRKQCPGTYQRDQHLIPRVVGNIQRLVFPSLFSSLLCCKLREVTSPRVQGQGVQGRPAVAAARTATCALSQSILP